jgi:hypothetical protein
MTINQQWAKLIEATQDPTAPLKLQAAHTAVNALGQLMASVADEHVTTAVRDCLISQWPNDEIEMVCNSPEFVMALCGLLLTSMKGWKDSL